MGQKIKEVKGKIIFKHQTAAEWDLSNDGAGAQYVPDVGERVLYDPDETTPYTREKFGDGEHIVKDLPFATGQADWNQNDESAVDYVKNRTHYIESELNEVLIDNVTIDTFTKDGDNDWFVSAENPFTLPLKEMNGKKFRVVFDGVEYECWNEEFTKPKKDDEVNLEMVTGWYMWNAIGNASYLTSTPPSRFNSYPFCITQDYYRNGDEVQIFVFGDTNISHTISVVDITPTIKQIPKEFYDETIFCYTADGGLTLNHHASATASNALAIGMAAEATGSGSVAIGNGAVAIGNSSSSLGNRTTSSGMGSSSFGYGALASG